MNIQTTVPPTAGAMPGPNPSAPRVRPMAFPITQGRLWTAGLDEHGHPTTEEMDQVWLRVTPLGHHYASTDKHLTDQVGYVYMVCRGCDLASDFNPDDVACPHPATMQDVASVLLAALERPAPQGTRGYRWIKFLQTEVAA